MVCVCGHDITIWNCGVPVLGELNLKDNQASVSKYSGDKHWLFKTTLAVGAVCPKCDTRYVISQNGEYVEVEKV